jgi:hypothetical protein
VKTGNPNIVVAGAAELPRLSLADALLVVLVFARARAPQTEAAAARWAARYVAEVRPAPGAREAHLVLSAASALAGPCPVAGQEALHALATRRRLVDLCRALDEWEPPERAGSPAKADLEALDKLTVQAEFDGAGTRE